MAIFKVLFLILLGLWLVYLFYQFFRNNAVYKIRIHWIDTHDPRWERHEYNDMFRPSKDNWYGIKYPKDSDFV